VCGGHIQQCCGRVIVERVRRMPHANVHVDGWRHHCHRLHLQSWFPRRHCQPVGYVCRYAALPFFLHLPWQCRAHYEYSSSLTRVGTCSMWGPVRRQRCVPGRLHVRRLQAGLCRRRQPRQLPRCEPLRLCVPVHLRVSVWKGERKREKGNGTGCIAVVLMVVFRRAREQRAPPRLLRSRLRCLRAPAQAWRGPAAIRAPRATTWARAVQL
jgi:hypothetical protein